MVVPISARSRPYVIATVTVVMAGLIRAALDPWLGRAVPYLLYYPRENRNRCLAPIHGIGSQPDPRYENLRNNLGYRVKDSSTYRQYVALALWATGRIPEALDQYKTFLQLAPAGHPDRDEATQILRANDR